MDRWVPLFDIFLNSPSPEAEASIWFQQNHHQQLQHPTAAFLSLLLAPADVVSHQYPSSPPTIKRCMWLQTLPYAMQSRILSFLTIESRRFSGRLLCSIATQIIDSAKKGDDGTQQQEGIFWVVRAALNLLDAIPAHGRSAVVEGEDEGREELREEVGDGKNGVDFNSLPRWLKNTAAASRPLLPWLPLSYSELRRRTNIIPALSSDKESEDVGPMEEEAGAQSDIQVDPLVLSPQILERAVTLKAMLQLLDTPSDATHMPKNIQNLCLDAGGESAVPTVLSLIEPWETDDETMLVLLSKLLDNSELEYTDWAIHVFSAVVLPRLLILQRASSRVLLSSTIDFCKTHQKDIVNVLLFPLIHRKEGISAPLCDVLVKVMKECMHPSHVSAFCQRLLCMKRAEKDFVCLPCHRNMVTDELEWTESLFSLFQHILSWNVPLTPDTVDNLISMLEDIDCKFSKSLKYGSFLLSLVTKSDHAQKFHKLSLTRIAEKTSTFLTKSIVSKLS